MFCSICNRKMIPCNEELSRYTKNFLKVGELMCELHGTVEMTNEYFRW